MADVIINNFQRGMSNDVRSDFVEMRNIDVYQRRGIANIANRLRVSSQPKVSGFTFTADAATDQLTFQVAHTLTEGSAVTVSSTVALPTPLAPATIYFVIFVDSTRIKLATTLANALAGTAIDLTDAGTGTHTLVTINMKKTFHFTQDPRTAVIYTVDTDGRVWMTNNNKWVLITGNTLTNTNANGICVWKDYLFVFRNAAIDVWGNLRTDPLAARTWTNAWKALNSTAGSNNPHHVIWSLSDDIMYWVDDRYVGSLLEVTTFDPAAAGTYTFTSQALDLPRQVVAQRIEELGGNLLVLGTVGLNNYSTIFPWDRISATFFLPIKLNFVADMTIVHNNLLYILDLGSKKIWASNGTNIVTKREIPEIISDNFVDSAIGAAMVFKGRLWFTISATSNYSGVYSLDLDTNSLLLENKVSQNSYSDGFNLMYVTSLIPVNDIYYYVGWYNSSNTTGGIDSILGNDGSSYKYESYGAYFETALKQVGTDMEPRTFEQIEILLSQPLGIAEGIKVYYRVNTSDSYTLIETIDQSNFGQYLRITVPFNGVACTHIQIKCEMNAAPNSSGSPGLLEIRLR